MLLAACLLDPRERTSEPYSSVYCSVGTFPDFPFFRLAIFASTTGQCSIEQRSGINRI